MNTLAHLLNGEGAFANVPHIFEDLTLELVSERPAGVPHGIFEEVWHLVYWQRFLLARARGESPVVPQAAAESWPGKPTPEDEAAWQALVREFQQDLQHAREFAEQHDQLNVHVNPKQMLREVLEVLAVHNAYHFGRIVLLRQLQGAWPPPSGGETW